jgi:hypothetical protein
MRTEACSILAVFPFTVFEAQCIIELTSLTEDAHKHGVSALPFISWSLQ